MQTIAFGVDKQWDPAVQHRELYLITCDETLGQRLLSIHNLRFLIRIMENIRESIKEDRFLDYENTFMTDYLKYKDK